MTRWRQLLLLAGFWTGLPLLVSLAADLIEGQTPTYRGFHATVFTASYWWAWAPLTLAVLALSRRFPLRGRRLVLHGAVHVLASWLVALGLNLYLALIATVLPVEYSAEVILQQAHRVGHGLGVLSQLLYWSVLASGAIFGAYQHSRRQDALLTEARLQALKGQVRPHFLFNTLNTISTLMDEDVDAARQMITHLSELLRASFRGHTTQEVTLNDELALVRLYLDIEKIRFEDRLRVHFEIDDGIREALVPHLLLQPLVENAIHHGISRDSTAGELTVRATRIGKGLRLSVEDDGPGPSLRPNSEDEPAAQGIGLANTRGRLSELYGKGDRLELRQRQPRGTTVEVDIPFHRQPMKVLP